MARSKNSLDDREQPQENSGSRPPGRSTIGDRIAAFAMLDGMTQASQAQKILRLALIGFTNPEIAEMLQASPATVRQGLYSERKKRKDK